MRAGKRILSLFLVFCLTLGMLPQKAYATEITNETGIVEENKDFFEEISGNDLPEISENDIKEEAVDQETEEVTDSILLQSESEELEVDHGIIVDGVNVTSANASDIIVGKEEKGMKVSYDEITGILTLENAVIESQKEIIVFSEEALTLELKGKNTIVLTGDKEQQALVAKEDFMITGEGTLEIIPNPEEEQAIVTELEEDFVSTVLANSQEAAYEIYVAGIQVTEDNREDVMGDGSKSVSYDPITNTIILHNANLFNDKEISEQAVIKAESELPLSILLQGENIVRKENLVTEEDIAAQENNNFNILETLINNEGTGRIVITAEDETASLLIKRQETSLEEEVFVSPEYLQNLNPNEENEGQENPASETEFLPVIGEIILNTTPAVGAVLNPEKPVVTGDAVIESEGFEMKLLTGEWTKITFPITLEEKHMGASLRYVVKGILGSYTSDEVILSPQGIWITGIEPLRYSGGKVTHDFKIYDGSTLLQEKTDYTLTYQNNTKAYELSDVKTATASIAIVSEGAAPLTIEEGGQVSVTDPNLYNKKTAPRVIVKMKGNYKGQYTVYFTIEKQDIKEALADDITLVYNSKLKKPAQPKPVVTWMGKKLSEKRDYIIPEYQNKNGFKDPGNYEITLEGTGNFKGRKTINVTITGSEKEIAMSQVKVSKVKAKPWTAEGATQPEMVVKYKNTTLIEEIPDTPGEYTVSYLNNDKVGTATVVITGTGKDTDGDGFLYQGTKKVTFKVNGTAMSKVAVDGLLANYDYTGEEICPTKELLPENSEKKVKLQFTDKKTGQTTVLTEAVDYEVSYLNNKNTGKATITFTGNPEAGYTGSKKQTFNIRAVSLKPEGGEENGELPFEIRIVDENCITEQKENSKLYKMPYMKGGVKPAVMVISGGVILTEGKDYQITYKNNKKVMEDLSNLKAAPTVVITGKGNYKGSESIPFAITPKAAGEGERYQGQVEIVVNDKEVKTGNNGWKQSFQVVDADKKKLSKSEYELVSYTIDRLPENADAALQAIKEAGTNLLEAPITNVCANSTIKVTVNLKGSYSGTITQTYRILEKGYDISKANIKLKPQEYTGRPVLIDSNEDFANREINKKPESLLLVKDGDHEPNIRAISYEKNIAKGNAKVTFEGMGEYGGVKTVSFKIGQRSILDVWAGIFNGFGVLEEDDQGGNEGGEGNEGNEGTDDTTVKIGDLVIVKEDFSNIGNYYNKKEVLQLKFTDDSVSENSISSVRVNGTSYSVEKESGVSTFSYELPETAGEHIITMDELVLVNGTTIPLEEPKTVTVYILKDVPSVEEIDVRKGEDYKHWVDLTLKDGDGAIFEDATPELLLIKDNIVVEEFPLNIGGNSIEVDLDPETEYTLDVRVSYDVGNSIRKREVSIKTKEFTSLFQVKTALTVSNLKLADKEGQETAVFVKNQEVYLTFEIDDRKFVADRVVIGEKEYPATTENKKVLVTIPAQALTDTFNADITALKMGEYEATVQGSTTVQFGIIKNKPVVESIGTKKVSEGIEIQIKITDEDNTVTNLKGQVYRLDAEEPVLLENKELQVGENIWTIPLATDCSDYRIQILADYTQGTDYTYTGEILRTKDFHITTANLDLKDITEFKLYKEAAVVESFSASEQIPSGEELAKYYLEIQPAFAPKLYIGVKDFEVADGKLYAIAALDEFLTFRETGEGLESEDKVAFEIPYEGESQGPVLKSAQQFIEGIKSAPSGEHKLTEDLDASQISTSDAQYITAEFTGTLDGDGHTIYGLQKPLFNMVNGGTIENIKFVDANISNNVGVVAVEIKNGGKADYITIDNCKITSTGSGVGAIAGKVISSGTISNSKILNSAVSGFGTLGGVVGEISAGGSVEGCFVYETSVSGVQSHGNLGTRVGGVTGWLNSQGSITSTYTNVTLSSVGNHGAGGLIGGPASDGGTIENCFSASIGTGQQIAGFDAALGRAVNAYQLSGAKSKNSATGVKEIAQVDKSFITDTLALSEDCWDIIAQKEALLGEGTNLREVSGYQQEFENRYLNIMKIAPFLNTESVIQSGNYLDNDNLINKVVAGVYPFDENGEYVEYLKQGEEDKIVNIKISFTDNTFDTYQVSYVKTADDIVAVYDIVGDTIPYHFNGYVVNDSLNLASYISEEVAKLDYDTDVKTTVSEYNARTYKEAYENEIKANADDFAEKLLASRYNYSVSNNSLGDRMKAQIEDELAKMLYTYTYLRRSYDFEIGGINIAELLMFKPENLSDELSQDYFFESLAAGGKETNNVYNKYQTMIESKTGTPLYEQLEFFIRMSGTEDYNDWFIKNWGGYVKEQEPIGYNYTPKLNWRIWDNLTNLRGDSAQLLNLLAMPKNLQPEIGILTTSSQILISDVNMYFAEPTEENRAKFAAKIDALATSYGRYYGSSLNYVVNGEENLNNDLCVGYDSILKYQNPAYKGVAPAQSNAPMVKYIAEPNNKIYTGNAGAVANGSTIYYGYMYAVDAFGTFTHENAHNQDSQYFFNNEGRKKGASAEHYAEGFLTEPLEDGAIGSSQVNDGDVTVNRTKEWNITADVITAFTYERVNTALEIQDYYAKLFDSWYGLNSLAANAFLRADNHTKYNAAFKVNEEISSNGQSIIAQYVYGYYEEDFAAMNLKTVEDLYDSRVAYKAIGTTESGYSRANFWDILWYIPSNDKGISDTENFKLMAHEMLGYAGWDEGLVAWASGRYDSDEEAIQAITGYSSMKEYKLARYDEAMEKLEENPYFDSERMEDIFIQVFKTQKRGNANWGKWLKKTVIQSVKRMTADFTDGDFNTRPENNYYEIDNAADLVEIINDNSKKNGLYIKLTDDIDMSEVTTSKDYFCELFIGMIDGNGYKITGLSKPLFTETKFAMFHNLELEGTANVLLSKTANYTLVYDSYFDVERSLFTSATLNNNAVFTYFNNEAVK